ncbi:hypothetical protein AE0388_0146, partial [Brevibacterium linens]
MHMFIKTKAERSEAERSVSNNIAYYVVFIRIMLLINALFIIYNRFLLTKKHSGI